MNKTNRQVLESWTNYEIRQYISELLKGCGKEMPSGDCWHYRPNGTMPVYCSSCTRGIKLAKEVLKERKGGW